MEIKPKGNEVQMDLDNSNVESTRVRRYRRVRMIMVSLLTLAIAVVLTYQVSGSISKFLSSKTTWTSEVVTMDRQLLPAISFCAGYRREVANSTNGSKFYEHLTIPSYFDESHAEDPATEEDITTWWRSINYEAYTLFAFIKSPLEGQDHLGDDAPVLTPEDFNETLSINNLTVIPVSSTYGICYTLVFTVPIPSHTSLILQLNLTEGPSRVSAYVHAPGDQVGLFHNYWPRFVAHYDLEPEAALDLPLEKQVRRTRRTEQNPCREGGQQTDYGDCILDWMKRNYVLANCSQGNNYIFNRLRTKLLKYVIFSVLDTPVQIRD